MKKSILLWTGLLCLAGLLCFSSCIVCPKETCFAVSVKNESENAYSVELYNCFEETDLSQEFRLDSETCYGSQETVDSEKRESAIGYCLKISYINPDAPDAILFVVNVRDSGGNIVYKACGWPESWVSDTPENWKNPVSGYDRFGIGYIDSKNKNGSHSLFYMKDGKEQSTDGSLEYKLTVKADGTVTFE